MDVPRFHPSRSQAGFTLVELIAVIVILGILAATALPQFVGLGSDARKAALGAARGSLETVKAVAHGQSLIVGSLIAPVGVERFTVPIVNGYPSAATATAAAAGLSAADWTITVSGRNLVVSPKSAASRATCNVTYSEATADGTVITPPTLVVVDSGC